MLEGKREKLLHMEEALRARVIGQDEAIVANLSMRSATTCRPAGPEIARSARFPVPRTNRHRQDRVDQGARRLPVRQ